MSTQYGTRVDAPVVAGNNSDDDIASAIGRQIQGSFQYFDTVADMQDWSAKFKSRVYKTVAKVQTGANGEREEFKWDGINPDGSDGKWVKISDNGGVSLQNLDNDVYGNVKSIKVLGADLIQTKDGQIIIDIPKGDASSKSPAGDRSMGLQNASAINDLSKLITSLTGRVDAEATYFYKGGVPVFPDDPKRAYLVTVAGNASRSINAYTPDPSNGELLDGALLFIVNEDKDSIVTLSAVTSQSIDGGSSIEIPANNHAMLLGYDKKTSNWVKILSLSLSGKASETGSGPTLSVYDSGNGNFTGIEKLMFGNAIVTGSRVEKDKVTVTSVVKLRDEKQFMKEATDCRIVYPLQIANDPSLDNSALISIDQEHFNKAYDFRKAEGYLGYLGRDLVMTSQVKQSDDTHLTTAYLYPDSTMFQTKGKMITPNPRSKCISLTKDIDQNIDFYVGVTVDTIGVADVDGEVVVSLIETSNPNVAVNSASGEPMAKSHQLQRGENVGSFLIDGVLSLDVDSLDLKVKIQSTCGSILISGVLDGLTGVVVQELRENEQVGQAMTKWTADTGISPILQITPASKPVIEMPSIEAMKADGIEPDVTYPSAFTISTIDGWSLYSKSEFAIKMDDEALWMDDSSFINFGVILDEKTTSRITGKKLTITSEMAPYSGDFMLLPLNWMRKEDAPAFPAVTGIDANGKPVLSPGWYEVTSPLNIPKLQKGVTHTYSVYVGDSVQNLAFVIVPAKLGTKDNLAQLAIKSFKVVENDAKTTYDIKHKSMPNELYMTTSLEIFTRKDSHTNVSADGTAIPVWFHPDTRLHQSGNAPIYPCRIKEFEATGMQFDKQGSVKLDFSMSYTATEDANFIFYAMHYDRNGKLVGNEHHKGVPSGMISSSQRLFSIDDSETVRRDATFTADVNKGDFIVMYAQCAKSDVIQLIYQTGTYDQLHRNSAAVCTVTYMTEGSGNWAKGKIYDTGMY